MTADRAAIRTVETCTHDMIVALEAMIEDSGDRAVIYGNSALAAVIIVFKKYGVDVAMNRELFQTLWAPVAGTTTYLEG